jgi:ATP-dependent Lhr-like helicase
MSKLPWISAVHLEVLFGGTADELEAIINDILRSEPDLYGFPLPEKVQVRGKYNEFVPETLLRKQFIEDYLDFEGLRGAMQ